MGLKEAVDKADTPEGKALIEAEYQKKAALLQKRNDAYNNFCEENGLKKLNERVTIAKWDRKQAAKVRGAAKKYEKDLEKQKNFDIIEEENRKIFNLGQNARLHIPPEPIFARGLTFDDNHVNKESKHNVTRDMAVLFVEQSKASITVWNGKFERYYGTNGAVYVNLEKNEIRTAFSGLEFDEKIKKFLEVLKKWILSILLAAL